MEIIGMIGKILFGILFLDAAKSHFQYKDANVAYTRMKGLPFAELQVVVSGILLIIAPILYIIGIWELAALTGIAIFLFLTCILFHNYWAVSDMQAKQIERMSFYKNMALLGATLVLISTL